MYRLGIDLGSAYTKGVLVDGNDEIVACLAVKTGHSFAAAGRRIIAELSRQGEIESPFHSCGYGREHLEAPFVTHPEIIALARGVYRQLKGAATVIDIGGQDTKYVKIAADGMVETFRLNRKCAAGTGSFLEEIAFRLDIAPEKFNELAAAATEETKLSSFCTVFAVSEIIGLIKNGAALADIALGVYNSVIERCLGLGGLEPPVVLTGGIPATHPALVELFRQRIPGAQSPARAQFLAAYGCVLGGGK